MELYRASNVVYYTMPQQFYILRENTSELLIFQASVVKVFLPENSEPIAEREHRFIAL